MQQWEKEFSRSVDEYANKAANSIGKGISNFFKGTYYGTKKLKERRFLIGFIVTLLITFLSLVFKEKFYIISNTVYRYLAYWGCLSSSFIYLYVISGTSGYKNISEDLRKAGVIGHDGQPPILKYKYKDKKGYEILVFNGLVNFSYWKKKIEDIETVMNISIKDINQGKSKSEVIIKTVPGVIAMPGGTGNEKTDEEREKVILRWSDEFIKEKDNLVSIGRNELEEIVADFDTDPHFIVAGATGSGKSVTIRSMVWQFIARGHKCIFVDFKGGLEFSQNYQRYGDTITDRPGLLKVLKLLVKENELRQKAFLEKNAKNINDYNKKSSKKMYRVILVIDELGEVLDKNSISDEEKGIADEITGILSSFGRVSRVTGIHMILGIQRPDANVVNGQIKTNVTGRICGRVSDAKASEIVLNDTAAAKLPKVKGRMIYQNAGEMMLFQGYFFDDDTDLKVVKVPGDRLLAGGDVGRDDGEELFLKKTTEKRKKVSGFNFQNSLKNILVKSKLKLKTKEIEVNNEIEESIIDEFESGNIDWDSVKNKKEMAVEEGNTNVVEKEKVKYTGWKEE